jgi:hypothetical protein
VIFVALNLNFDFTGISHLKEWWPIVKSNLQSIQNVFNDHLSGASDKHTADKIEYTAGGESIKEKFDKHADGTADKHAAQDVTYSGNESGTDVKTAIDNIHNRVNTIVAGAGSSNTEIVDARHSTSKSKDFTVLTDRLEEIETDATAQKADTTAKLATKALQTSLDATNATVALKANKDEVTNVMTPKGNIAYASLPTTGNTVGWYYYCSDGDGTHGAGNLAKMFSKSGIRVISRIYNFKLTLCGL